MVPLHIVALCGSLRKDSLNKKILNIAVNIASSQDNASVTVVDLSTLDIPIYNYDTETEGFPDAVVQLKKQIEQADMLIIASPEYNHSIPGGLKNAIDWLSRGTNSLSRKTVAIMGASSGRIGTARMQMHLRIILANLNVFVTPYPEVLVSNAEELVNEQGTITDERTTRQIEKLITKTIEYTQALKPFLEKK